MSSASRLYRADFGLDPDTGREKALNAILKLGLQFKQVNEFLFHMLSVHVLKSAPKSGHTATNLVNFLIRAPHIS